MRWQVLTARMSAKPLMAVGKQRNSEVYAFGLPYSRSCIAAHCHLSGDHAGSDGLSTLVVEIVAPILMPLPLDDDELLDKKEAVAVWPGGARREPQVRHEQWVDCGR